MNTTSAFFRLIRWPNLVFIALTQILFYYFVILPNYKNTLAPVSSLTLFYLISASVLIAAAGYIINDYFDLNIDLVNKPEKMVIDNHIKRRWAIVLHFVFSGVGILLSFLVSLESNFIIFTGNILCVVLLWLYSTTFKKQLLIGNVVISLLTAWVIIVCYLTLNKSFIFYTPNNFVLHKVFRFAILYASFAFIISLVREVVKDIEDIHGDSKYQCKTMPIVWGIPVSKVFAGVWISVLICALIALQFYVLQVGWWVSSVYTFLFVVLPLGKILQDLYQAQTTKDYGLLSKRIKIVMLTGILSMIFIRIYM
ncbi:MAG: geranylgeranylglycerol-phosphate geranylgeranyltransferase [Ginsengibacter sp.]